MNIKKIFAFAKNEFIYGGHLLSLGAASIVFTSAVLLDTRITWDFLLIAYLVVYVANSYNRMVEFKKDFLTNPLRSQHLKNYIEYLPCIIITSFSIIAGLLLKFGNLGSLAFVLFMIVGSVLYTMYFKDVTRRVVGFKSFYVSFFWASLIVLLALYYGLPVGLSVSLVFLFVFSRIIVNAIFFDIKDINSDALYGLKTLPAYLGKEKVFVLMHILNVFSFFPLLFGVYTEKLPAISLSLVVFYFYTFYYLSLIDKKNVSIQKLSYIMVDGEYVLWSVIVLLFKFLIIDKW